MKIYLASKSPRRKELLKQMEIEFDVLAIETPEIVMPNETPVDYSMRVTNEKLVAAWDTILQQKLPRMPVLCADTEVVLDGRILGKPANAEEAFNMLALLSNREHEVITSVGVFYSNYQKIRLQKTIVTFATLSDDAIHHYLMSDNYKDKAGSYGIQSYIGQFICRIDGCFYSVMGLPLSIVRELLIDLKKCNSVSEAKNT